MGHGATNGAGRGALGACPARWRGGDVDARRCLVVSGSATNSIAALDDDEGR